MDHKSVAERVLQDVGGVDNIRAAAHCATRLRLVLKNQDSVDQSAIDNDEDLKGSFLNAGQFQIIVGPGDVNEVFKHMVASGAPEVSKDDLKSIAANQGNIFSRFIKTIADIFIPLIPVLVGGGMLMALDNVLRAKNIFGPKPLIEMYPAWEGFADIVNLLSAAPFAFLPVLVGYSATKVFGGNPYLGLTMGAAMVSPALMNGYKVAASLAHTEGTDPMKYWDLFGLQVQQAGYQGTVLPILLVSFILANIEKFFHKILKGTIDFIFTPTLTLLITGFVTFLLVGPPMFQLGTWLGEGVNWLYTAAGPIGGADFWCALRAHRNNRSAPVLPTHRNLTLGKRRFLYLRDCIDLQRCARRSSGRRRADHQEQENQRCCLGFGSFGIPGYYRTRTFRCESGIALAFLYRDSFGWSWRSTLSNFGC